MNILLPKPHINMKALPKTAYLQLTHVYAYTYINAYMRWKGTTLVDLQVTFFWSM